METFQSTFQEFKVQAKDAVDKVRSLIHEGNIRRIIVRDQRGHTFIEIPMTVAAVGVVAAPVLAAVGAIAALVADFNIVVERAKEPEPAGDSAARPAP
jgi:hypothetical protein